MRCNCENSHCSHGLKPCPNEAGDKKVMYVGRVCDECYEQMPEEFRLGAEPVSKVLGEAFPFQLSPGLHMV